MAKANARLKTTVRDMVLSLLVIAVPIAVVLVLKPSKAGNPVHVMDTGSYQSELSAARAAEPFTVLAPAGLPADWKLTSAYYQPAGSGAADWHVGYLTPGGGYATLEQTTEPLSGYLSDQHSNASPDATVQIAGATPNVWQRYSGTTPGGLRTLLSAQDGKSTVIVAGSAPLAELERLAAALR
ncbi:DUF4245 domain-containing protein [Actinocrinis puniceicyclus]|uniref:DUF4245 domain-containing protein n=1 Tax=Actinocrinis puniceicyclus TaxID=977794 RepID=A0A8J8BA12_9ACTN|nr:DUF4245 domain-containing protein [Actinocrinis puniceicyclus]MBS2962437.1 DUF4245 domain-containing protein [Actinocrinis puniceicyclus]